MLNSNIKWNRGELEHLSFSHHLTFSQHLIMSWMVIGWSTKLQELTGRPIHQDVFVQNSGEINRIFIINKCYCLCLQVIIIVHFPKSIFYMCDINYLMNYIIRNIFNELYCNVNSQTVWPKLLVEIYSLGVAEDLINKRIVENPKITYYRHDIFIFNKIFINDETEINKKV